MVTLQHPEQVDNTWILGRHIMEKYFILFDNRPTESGMSKVNNIGISACDIHSSEHIDMIDDTEGRHSYSLQVSMWTEMVQPFVDFYK